MQEGFVSFQPGYAPIAAAYTVKLINRVPRDACVTDLRLMAHTLATACHEAREIKKFQVPTLFADCDYRAQK